MLKLLTLPRKHSYTLLLVLFFAETSHAKVILPDMLASNMVLQQKTHTQLWGKATAGKTVVITTSWNKKSYQVKTGANGDWKVKIATPVAGGPYTIDFNDGETLRLDNILIGDVWVCSGQSNMEMP